MSWGHYLVLNVDVCQGGVKSGEFDEGKKAGCGSLAGRAHRYQ